MALPIPLVGRQTVDPVSNSDLKRDSRSAKRSRLTLARSSVDSADSSIYNDHAYYQWMGDGAARAQDFTGDGVSDVLQSHFWDDHNGTYSGSVGFFEGPVSSGSAVIYDADLGFIYGQSAQDRLGYEVEVAEDIDGDGLPDLVISALQRASADYGKVYVVTDTPPYGQNLQSIAAATITGDEAAGAFGVNLTVGDIFDGQDDIIVGAQYYGSGSDGVVYMFHGPLTGSLSASSADVFIEASASGAGLGTQVSRACDLVGDGLLDLAVGAGYEDTHGNRTRTVHLIYGL